MNELKSMFTDEEFEQMRAFLVVSRPDFANPEKVRAEIKKLDDYIANEILTQVGKEDPEQLSIATNITLQGRNLLARLIGELERPMPDIQEFTAVPEPITLRHVAVYSVSDSCEVLQHVLTTIQEKDVRYKVYKNMSALIDAILNHEICGIVSISITSRHLTRIESLIRHELKNREGWTRDKADQLVLPPCIDATDILYLVHYIHSLLAGNVSAIGTTFNLIEVIPWLVAKMFVPPAECDVIIIDDKPDEVAGIETILAAWPRLKPIKIICSGASRDLLSHIRLRGYGIVLLDEDMGDTKGSVLANQLRESNPRVIIASITGGNCPSYTRDHFQAKTYVEKDSFAAVGFVRFMNAILQRKEKR